MCGAAGALWLLGACSQAPSATLAPATTVAPVPTASLSAAPPLPAASETPAASGSASAARVAPAPGERGERWGPALRDSGPCVPHAETPAETTLSEPEGPREKFSVHGYRAWQLRVQRVIDGEVRTHCAEVAFPPGDRNSDGQPSRVAARIDDGWLRAIENTLQRLPWRHLQVVRRLVIDNRPREHGIAPFDRRKPSDGRDGHSIWLHERLFTEPNHWARGNHGLYWSYHLDHDDETLDDLGSTHARFSPVLLHEIGHLVSYNVINGNAANEAVPACARVCGDRPGGCRGMLAAVRERGCISAYCMPMQYETGTENWAEQYRLFYQGEAARGLLETAAAGCRETLDTFNDRLAAPWAAGLGGVEGFHRTRWASCGERACKEW